MKHKKFIFVSFAIIAAVMFIFFQRKSHEDISVSTTVVTKKEKPQINPALSSGTQPVTQIVDSQSEEKESDSIQSENEDVAVKPLITKKSKVISLSSRALKLRSVNVEFARDLYACSELECSNKDSVLSKIGFNIFKGNIPTVLDSKSKSLVTFNKETAQYGIWERRVIIETKRPVDLKETLLELHFEAIERPQPQLYIAEYVGNVSALNGILNDIKKMSDVSDVRLEITYSKDRAN